MSHAQTIFIASRKCVRTGNGLCRLLSGFASLLGGPRPLATPYVTQQNLAGGGISIWYGRPHKRPIIQIYLLHITLVSMAIFYPLDAGVLRGVVIDAQTGKPLSRASVTVQQTGARRVTDTTGAYAVDSLAPGAYTVVFSHDRHETFTASDVYMAGDGEKRLDAELPPVAMLDKMVVRGVSFQKPPDLSVSAKTITADELLRAPGALSDVQRAVQQLPSVSSGGDQTNEIVVRGGTPGENLFILDNIEIPNPNHFANEGSGGGVISLVNPLLVKGLTFTAGAPPAQYGDKASSVLDVRMRDGNAAMALGGVDMGIAGAGVHLEGPFWGSGNFMFSARRSFLDWVAHSSFNTAATAVPKYWGMQTRLARSGPSDKLYADWMYGDDGITIDNAREDLGTRGQTITSGGTVYAAGGTDEHFWGDHVSSSVTLSAAGNTFDRLEFTGAAQGGPRDTFYRNGSREQEQTLKVQASYDFDNSDRVVVGGLGRRCDYSIDIGASADTLKRYDNALDTAGEVVDSASGSPVLFRDAQKRRATAYKFGGFASAILRPFERVKVVPGLRFDGFTGNKTLTVSPRLSGVYSLTPQCDLTGALGVQYQQPDYAVLAGNPLCPPKRALTGIAGVEYRFGEAGVQCIVEGFYKRYDHMPVDSSLLSVDQSVQEEFSTSHGVAAIGAGRSYGVEAFAQKKLTREFSWTASYSLSDSKNKDPRPLHAGQWYPGDYDFGQGVTLSAGWKKELLKAPWYRALKQKTWFKMLSPFMPVADRNELSARWRYLGGRPYTQSIYDTTYHRWHIEAASLLNASRYLDYHTLDLRWERRFGFGFLQMMYYFDLQNVYDRKNVWQYLFVDGRPQRSVVWQLPFFPAGGMIIGF